MESIKENLGKVAITVEKDYWSIDRAYDRLVIVEVKGAYKTYISRKPVPAGTMLNDREYWIPFSSLKEELTADYRAWLNKVDALLENNSSTESEEKTEEELIKEQETKLDLIYSRIAMLKSFYHSNNVITMILYNCSLDDEALDDVYGINKSIIDIYNVLPGNGNFVNIIENLYTTTLKDNNNTITVYVVFVSNLNDNSSNKFDGNLTITPADGYMLDNTCVKAVYPTYAYTSVSINNNILVCDIRHSCTVLVKAKPNE